MPVKYIEVAASSDLFVAATRAYGDIAIIGKGAAGTAACSSMAARSRSTKSIAPR